LSTDSVRGKAVLVVNVASRCGFTPQYEALEKLHQSYKDRGFTVLGVPCNQFGEQEPGSADEIATFCSTTYGVTFPLTEKLDVNGAHRHPLYQLLTAARDSEGRAGDVEWNFEKFLVSPKGEVAARFRSMVAPDADEVVGAVERVLKAGAVETTWAPVQAQEVRAGDRVRLGSGALMTVSRVESPFLGRETLVCLIEDSPERWLAQPVLKTSQVEVERPVP
jgi:glutathione peroxidase